MRHVNQVTLINVKKKQFLFSSFDRAVRYVNQVTLTNVKKRQFLF
ncbi:MAG: hypothetical protein ACI93H_000460, partial [Psychromonas sp.]